MCFFSSYHPSLRSGQGGNSWGGWVGHSPPNFWPTILFGGFHTPLTERYHQINGFFYVSDKTAIVQLKISRNMMLINIGGEGGGHFRHANVEK